MGEGSSVEYPRQLVAGIFYWRLMWQKSNESFFLFGMILRLTANQKYTFFSIMQWSGMTLINIPVKIRGFALQRLRLWGANCKLKSWNSKNPFSSWWSTSSKIDALPVLLPKKPHPWFPMTANNNRIRNSVKTIPRNTDCLIGLFLFVYWEKIRRVSRARMSCSKGLPVLKSGVGIVHPGFFFGEVFLTFEVEAGTHFGES